MNQYPYGFISDGQSITTVQYPGSIQTVLQGGSGDLYWGTYVVSSNLFGFYGQIPAGVPFVYDGTNYTSIAFPGGNNTSIIGVANKTIFGSYTDQASHQRGFLYDYSGKTYSSISYPGSTLTTIWSISDGVVYGQFVDPANLTHYFRYQSGHYVVINYPGSSESWGHGLYGNLLYGGYYDSNWNSHIYSYNGTNYASVTYPGSYDSWFNGGDPIGNKVWGGYYDSNGVSQVFVYDPRYHVTPPVITLNGANPMSIVYGMSYSDPGATVVDPIDGTNSITGTGSVDPSAPGSYTLTYGYTNSQGTVALPVTRTVSVTPAAQTITFPALASVAVGSGPVTPGATASSGLAVTYTSSAPNVASVSGSTLTILGAGTTSITASQPGNADYLAAPAVTQILVVTNTQVITNPPSPTNVSVPPSWTSPDGLRYSAVVYAQVVDSTGKVVSNAGSMLGVFNGGNCAGVTTLIAGPNGPLFQLPVYANQTPVSGMVYKLYNGTTGAITTLAESYNFTNGSVTGSIASPITLHMVKTQSIPVYQGWTWISFNVLPVDGTWGTLLGAYRPNDNDLIIGAEGSTTYYGGTWYSSSTNFVPKAGRMYLISSETGGTLTATGYPVATPVSLNLVTGWNWIGCPDVTNTTLLDMMPGMASSNNDHILSQLSQSGTYWGGVWYNTTGTNFPIAPGQGYLLYLNGSPQTVPLQ